MSEVLLQSLGREVDSLNSHLKVLESQNIQRRKAWLKGAPAVVNSLLLYFTFASKCKNPSSKSSCVAKVDSAKGCIFFCKAYLQAFRRQS